MAKLFVGFNFSSESLLSRKITGFRKRFDPKYNQYSFPHMAALAPFEVYDNDVEDLKETLKEEIDTFYFEKKDSPKLSFNGLGVYEHRKKNILYLNPVYDAELNFLSEMVVEICKSHIPRSIRYRENKQQFLPLGIFYHHSELFEVMEQARIEFSHSSHLPIKSISLYQSKFGIWQEIETLVSFEENPTSFLQMSMSHI